MNYGSNNSHSVNNEESKAFGRGLFNQDPHIVQQKRKKQNFYKEELLKQIQESKRKKQQEKKKQRQYDAKMEQKFYEQLKVQEGRRQKYQKTYKRPEEIKPHQEGSTNNLKQQKKYSNSANTIVPILQFQDFDMSQIKTTHKQYEDNRTSGLKGYFYEQEDRMLANMRLQKQRRYKESLDLKVQEIYKQIQDTKRALKLDKQLQRIRRQLKQTNSDQSYSSLQDSAYQFKDQVSQFYSLPKQRQRPQKNLADFSRVKHISNSNSRVNRSNENGTKGYGDRWGQSGIRGNFLGNRQALDYQIGKIMGDIDAILPN